jgi:hypothetical protein
VLWMTRRRTPTPLPSCGTRRSCMSSTLPLPSHRWSDHFATRLSTSGTERCICRLSASSAAVLSSCCRVSQRRIASTPSRRYRVRRAADTNMRRRRQQAPEAAQRNPAFAPGAPSLPRLTPAGQNPDSPQPLIRPQAPQLHPAKPMLRQHDLPTLRLTGEAVFARTTSPVVSLEILTAQLARPSDEHIVSLNLTISHSRIVRLLPWHGPKQKHQAEPPKADGAVSIRS